MDKYFWGKFMWSIEHRVQEFIQLMAAKTNIWDANVNFFRFNDLKTAIEQGQFMVNATPWITELVDKSSHNGNDFKQSSKRKADNSWSDQKDTKSTANPSSNKQDSAPKKITNDHPNSNWIMADPTMFGRKYGKYLSRAPEVVNNTKACVRWHVMGFCSHGLLCYRKSTHKVLKGDDKDKFQAFVTKCSANEE